jgi:hypothetical protein
MQAPTRHSLEQALELAGVLAAQDGIPLAERREHDFLYYPRPSPGPPRTPLRPLADLEQHAIPIIALAATG